MNEKLGVLTALGAAILASICCIGPVVLAGVGVGAVAAAQTFAPYRPLFLAITAVFLGSGFYFAYRKPKHAVCDGEVCETARVARWSRPLLWLATVIILALVAFPYYYAPLRGALEKPTEPDVNDAQATQLATVELNIGGMTCDGCAATIKSKLLETPGVVKAEVRYPEGLATIQFNHAQTNTEKLIAAVKSTGYSVSGGASMERRESRADSDAPEELEPFFVLELQYRGRIELAPIGEKIGRLAGGGDGTLTGRKLKGRVRWSNYETTGNDGICSLQVPGVIHTHDGAEIRFEGRELAMPASDGSKKWKVAGVMRFHTDDPRYVWINETLAVTSGTFDYESGRARWSAYAPR